MDRASQPQQEPLKHRTICGSQWIPALNASRAATASGVRLSDSAWVECRHPLATANGSVFEWLLLGLSGAIHSLAVPYWFHCRNSQTITKKITNPITTIP